MWNNQTTATEAIFTVSSTYWGQVALQSQNIALDSVKRPMRWIPMVSNYPGAADLRSIGDPAHNGRDGFKPNRHYRHKPDGRPTPSHFCLTSKNQQPHKKRPGVHYGNVFVTLPLLPKPATTFRTSSTDARCLLRTLRRLRPQPTTTG